ncbi:hypothetical protein [Mesorhizobium sp.]|uniref:hypothetical protein n=1 Tax=Mesorhizobium sp. TaxID=1871066 RepID=UPI000FEA3D78|nr:hypothetical protein [Mesorhizobium sp.]RWC28815.1 MAG: hypothetical protein EOS27_17900 [Mesorhizobium sp.]TIX28274.1 MAG: hypothetical protein E5V35_02745 [Mesorhizobium sp.]
MRARVIIPPDPIVTSADIAGAGAGNAAVDALIQAVTEDIDGPGGWLGRSLGPQTIELFVSSWDFCRRLPYGPIIDIDGITYIDSDGNEQPVDGGSYEKVGDCILFAPSWSAPDLLVTRPLPVRIQYQAGYDGEDISGGGTGAVPERARQAIILSVQHLRSLQVESLYLKVDEVDGVGRREFTLSEQASNLVEKTCERLLSTLQVLS